jgi:hypothetical protein
MRSVMQRIKTESKDSIGIYEQLRIPYIKLI